MGPEGSVTLFPLNAKCVLLVKKIFVKERVAKS